MMKSTIFSFQMGLLVGLPIFVLAGPAARAQALTALPDIGLYPNPAHIRATVEIAGRGGCYSRHGNAG